MAQDPDPVLASEVDAEAASAAESPDRQEDDGGEGFSNTAAGRAAAYSELSGFLISLAKNNFRFSHETAQDVVHAVFSRLFNGKYRIRYQRAFLAASVKRECVRLAATMRRRGEVSLDSDLDREDAGGRAEDVLGSFLILDAVSRLPPRFGRAVHLHCIEGYSLKVVAEMLDTTPGYVQNLVHEGRALLRRMLAPVERGRRRR